ncbi:MAG: response regulator [Nitriliruptorales bacterium]|nr:response regulator [Nitriliruptorales bacterium]
MDRRILIVDDDDGLREVLSLYIGFEDGLEVVGTAATASEAADLVTKVTIDAIVLDYHMPGVDGIEAIPMLRAAAPAARIVMFSADDDRRASDEAIERGAAAYVTKNGQQGLDDIIRQLKAS